MRDVMPNMANSDIFGTEHGRDVAPPGGGEGVRVWMTEHNIDTSGTDLSDPDDPGGDPITPDLTVEDKRRINAKALIRNFAFWLNKGAERIYLYAATSDQDDLSVIDPDFFDALTSDPVTYPGDSAGGLTVDAIGRMVAHFTPSTITTPITVTVDYVGQYGTGVQFEGDGSDEHPDLHDRDVLAVLPFQLSDTSVAVAVYVMTRNVAQPQDLDAPGDDPTRFDLPASVYRLKLGGIPGTVSASGYDPLTGASVPVTVLQATGYQIILEVPVTDSPRIITLS
jgi:hypothetical protein